MNKITKNILIVCSICLVLVSVALQNIFLSPSIVSLTIVGTNMADVTLFQLCLVWVENVFFWGTSAILLIIISFFYVFLFKYEKYDYEIRYDKLKKFIKRDVLLLCILFLGVIVFRFLNETYFFYIMLTTLFLPIIFLIFLVLLLKKVSKVRKTEELEGII